MNDYTELFKRTAEALGKDPADINPMRFDDAIDELLTKIERYEKALEFYANRENYEVADFGLDPTYDHIHVVDMDEGEKARIALGRNL